MKKFILSLAAAATLASAVDVFPPSFSHPGDLPLDSIPQFICFGFDDNVYLDGFEWVDSLFMSKKHADGSPVLTSFYVSTHPSIDNPDLWDAINRAWKNGHEIANHTQTHHAETFNANMNSFELWDTEIGGCTEDLFRQSGIPASEITGFRTPFLGYSAATFEAMQAHNLQYDCSIEHFSAQYQNEAGEWGVGLIWPYTMENGKHSSSYGSLDVKAPGFWQLPVHEFVRATGWQGVTGLDWNLWFKGFKKQEVIELWQSSTKVRLEGDPARSMLANRCPLFIGMHSDEYTDDNPANSQAADNTPNRRAAIDEYMDWALDYHPAIRIVPMKVVIEWMKNPVKYSEFRYDPTNGTVQLGDKTVSVKTKFSAGISSNKLNLNMPIAGKASIGIYSLRGRKVADFGIQDLVSGKNEITMNSTLSAGSYIIRLQGEGFAESQKAIVF